MVITNNHGLEVISPKETTAIGAGKIIQINKKSIGDKKIT